MTESAKQHIERIRRTKFSIGGAENPLTEDLHQAVKNLSAELYAKDVHFLMELIQVSSPLLLPLSLICHCFCVFSVRFCSVFSRVLCSVPEKICNPF